MNLRQIIRNQKLINFDLTSLISESQRYKDFLDKAPKVPKPGKEGTRQGSSDVKIQTALNYKAKGFKGSDGQVDTSQQTAYQNALTYLQGAVETGELERKDLPGEFSQDVPSAVGDRYKDKEQDIPPDDKETSRPAKKKEKKEKKKKKEYDWRGEKHEPEGEDGRPSPSQINDLRTQMFDGKTGRSSDWAGKANSTPDSDPPSDAMARQTALDTGFPKKGTKPWPSSNVTGQAAAPAPGNAGSMMNEVFSVEGCNIAEAFYERFGTPPTVDEMEAILQEQFGDSQLAKDNGGPKSNDYRKKLRIAAEASVTKFDRLQNAQTNNPEFGKMIRPPSEFYGAADSIEAQAAMIRGAEVPPNKIYGPAGPIEEITDNPRTREELIDSLISIAKKHHKQDPKGPYAKFASGSKSNPNVDVDAIEGEVGNIIDDNNVKQFVEILAYAGGGGANPSDTATFAQSEDGNLMILFHSDKMSTEDQQANSTLGQEARRQEAYLNELIASGQLDEKDEAYAKRELEKFVDVFNETSAADDSVDMTPAILEMMDDPEKKAALIDAFHGSAKGNRPLIVPREGESREDYLDRKNAFEISPDDPQAREEQVEEFLQYFNKPLGDPPEGRPPATGDQSRFFQKLKENLAKDGKNDLFSEDEIEKIDSAAIGSERTKKVVAAIQARLAALDKIKTKDGTPVGQYIETKNIIDKLHLYAADDPSSLAYQSGMCATVIGSDIVTGEVLRSTLGIENSEDLIGKVKVGAAAAPKDDWTDEDGVAGPAGVPNSLIQRSTDSFVKKDGKPLYFTVGENGEINGTTTDESKAQRTKAGKPIKVGVPTGQKSLFYAKTVDGEECQFAMQAARSKEGPGKPLQTAYTYGGCMREGIKKYGKESMKEESVGHKLANILSETQENTLAYHWKKAEDDYPLHYFIRELNESSLK